jgi:aminomethyltransferase
MRPGPDDPVVLKSSPLSGLNEEHGARLVDFGGWEMPLQYQSVLAEHRAVRTAAGWFDVSHLGRFSWEGPGAKNTLKRLLANDVDLIGPGRTQYTLLLNEAGGIEDDLLIWQWDDERYWVLPNASTHDQVMARFMDFAPGVRIEDLRATTAMVAVQGPAAPGIIEAVLGIAPKRFRTYHAVHGSATIHLAGTGYTGERGGELVGDPEAITSVVRALTGRGAVPCGLGARDTLRLEAGLLLAGQDFDRETTPLEAGLEFAVAWDHDFVGRTALERARLYALRRRLVAFTLPGRKIPRHGYRIRQGDSMGVVTSGNFSPMLECGLGLGYLDPAAAGPLEVEIRGVWEEATQVELPFYQR